MNREQHDQVRMLNKTPPEWRTSISIPMMGVLFIAGSRGRVVFRSVASRAGLRLQRLTEPQPDLLCLLLGSVYLALVVADNGDSEQSHICMRIGDNGMAKTSRTVETEVRLRRGLLSKVDTLKTSNSR
jgi:hypothetical protein